MAQTANEQPKLAVLGGGPGGYPAAFAAADRGMSVSLIDDRERPGGVCLNCGCIPSKALLHVAKLLNEASDAADWGVSFSKPSIDLDKLREWKSAVIGKLTGGLSQLCRARGVNLIQARGGFLGSNTLTLSAGNDQAAQLTFDHAILATGSLPVIPPVFEIGDERVMDSTAALELPDIPQRLLVIGGGYIGLELGTVYAAIGAQVTLVEMTPGLLPGVDRDLVGPLKKRLERVFSAIHVNTEVTSLTAGTDGIVVELVGGGAESRQVFDRVLVAVGRRPNSGGLGLENTRVQVDEGGFVLVDKRQHTADPSILAIGDVTGGLMLAHKATRDAKVAVRSLAGETIESDNAAVPAVVFTDPELAWCGLTQTQAKSAGRKVTVFRFPWAASGRAQTLGRTEGLTKLVFDPETQQVLGMGIVGVGAGELIGEGVLAVETAATAGDLAECVHAHPTLSETIMESAEGFLGQATHLVRKK